MRFGALALALTLLAVSFSACAGSSSSKASTDPQPHGLFAVQTGPKALLARPGLTVGLNAGTEYSGDIAGAQAAVKRLGVRWVREEFRWSELEPRKGSYNWKLTDQLFTVAAQQGVHVLPQLYTTPRWAALNKLSLPRNPADYGSFAAAVVTRYGPGGTFWNAHPTLDARVAPTWFELWNEPYYDTFSVGGVNPAKYAQMVISAHDLGHAANDKARFLIAGERDYTRKDGSSGNWMADLFAAAPALNTAIDGVAVHPYEKGDPATQTGGSSVRARLDSVISELQEHGVNNAPLWMTEIGWSTCGTKGDCTNEASQATYLRDLFQLVASRYRNVVKAVFVYHLYDFSDVKDPVQRSFGMLRTNGSRKPAALVLTRAAHAALP